MGKRTRRRSATVPRPKATGQTARVRVGDATWAEYRQSLGGRSVAEGLGAHVELEVARWRRQRASRAELDDREVAELVERIEAAAATLETLSARLALRALPRSV
jgi:hypothetical protein